MFYRQSTKEKAIALGITGHVQNERDGSVSITATGTDIQLDELIAWCRRGPARAMVDQVHVTERSLEEIGKFNIRY